MRCASVVMRHFVTSSLRHSVTSRAAHLLAALAIPAIAASTAHASAFASYGQPYRTIAMPPTGAGSFGLMGDALADGRLLAVTGKSVFVESGVGTGVFSPVASLDPAQLGASGGADPTFVRVSPDGMKIAVGLGFGKPVAVFPVSALGTPGSPTTLNGPASRYFAAANYQGAWADNARLALTSSSGGFGSQTGVVTLLDTSSANPAAPVNPTIITGITGASGGVAFDSAGHLFTSNGYANSGSPTSTGTIKAFDASVLSAAVPLNFNSAGTLIGRSLSGDALVFDTSGNLFVGGGDFDTSDNGYFGIINGAAIGAALLGSPINPADASQLKRLFPDGTSFGYYGSAYNRVTGELYASETDFLTGDNTFYATIPGPGAGALLGMGVLAARRRR